MKETVKIILVLTLVCSLCAFLLTFTYSAAKAKIADNARDKTEQALKNLAPQAHQIEEILIGNDKIFKLSGPDNSLIGYGFIASGQGYQGTIEMLAIIDPSLQTLGGIEIIKSLETPGLGSKIQESPFLDQFRSLSVKEAIGCQKETPSNNNQIQAVTGATVSSRAVTNILNARIEALRKQMGRDQ